MRTSFLTAAVLAAAAVIQQPLAAQSVLAPEETRSYRTRTIVVFGDEACPVSTNPDEIIVCARRPEEERFRIPKDLRNADGEIARGDNVSETRAAIVDPKVGASGIGSCSAAGPGGMMGCNRGINVFGAGRTIIEGVRRATEPVDDED